MVELDKRTWEMAWHRIVFRARSRSAKTQRYECTKIRCIEATEKVANFIYTCYNKSQTQSTDKALKILRLQAEGLSVEKIAGQLGLSKAGVKYYNQETYKKLGVNNKAAAVAEARSRRLL